MEFKSGTINTGERVQWPLNTKPCPPQANGGALPPSHRHQRKRVASTQSPSQSPTQVPCDLLISSVLFGIETETYVVNVSAYL